MIYLNYIDSSRSGIGQIRRLAKTLSDRDVLLYHKAQPGSSLARDSLYCQRAAAVRELMREFQSRRVGYLTSGVYDGYIYYFISGSARNGG